MEMLEWLLQAVVIAMLGAALPYVLRLERQLRALRGDRGALERSAAELTDATRMAEAASLRLRASAETAGRQVAEKLAVAEPLRDDLHYLAERAEMLADRLDGLVRGARAALPPGAALGRASLAGQAGPVLQDPGEPLLAGALPEPAAVGAETGAARSRSERELLRALMQGGPANGSAA